MPCKLRPQVLSQFPELKPVFTARDSMRRETGRYAFHEYLTEVYRVGRLWSRKKIRKRRTKELMQLARIEAPRRFHAFRAIIQATLRSLDAKTASRWTRSLEFSFSENIPADKLKDFFRTKGGMANCARKAARELPKRTHRRPTWD